MSNQKKFERQLAEEVRKACLDAAQEGFREASMSGLSREGAMEAATGSIQSLNLEKIIARLS
jgi:hypothetical protein